MYVRACIKFDLTLHSFYVCMYVRNAIIEEVLCNTGASSQGRFMISTICFVHVMDTCSRERNLTPSLTRASMVSFALGEDNEEVIYVVNTC